ncbi:hypothetical protein N7448_000849 [Penicillium atrosanguineum]|uniref:Uncharacterized protein n=1 Tax=Penicillium atrosanguineum TaxID=1132637 RepID=A0A9W9HL79_9EURO|nr:uncharacterized protein N7443_004244 [Penicillium atrosanguineum]KAJ5134130.1 hypothetical protein N7526_005495 [Penicillium atrosanguineum]KAJ5149271.1 hypothetical protein N7448_000849 [Penicillium atrosanguineum]KAJ5304584.1 hypothetical protein N7443_004244 [Penicillium atrosanguineum]KAJ5324053.1 hypothetical protein N7476_002653 [Penicillium atrosanguineum]
MDFSNRSTSATTLSRSNPSVYSIRFAVFSAIIASKQALNRTEDVVNPGGCVGSIHGRGSVGLGGE